MNTNIPFHIRVIAKFYNVFNVKGNIAVGEISKLIFVNGNRNKIGSYVNPINVTLDGHNINYDEIWVSLSCDYYKCLYKYNDIMDIKSGAGYPASALSNFAGHRFTLDGVEIYSMEGFLQSLKFKSADIQVEVCKLIGKAAKFRGKPKKWYRDQTLYWRGIPIKRDSDEYQSLIDRAYEAMFEQSESFRDALKASGKSSITHSMGKSKISETVLTEREFCSRLMKLRTKLYIGNV